MNDDDTTDLIDEAVTGINDDIWFRIYHYESPYDSVYWRVNGPIDNVVYWRVWDSLYENFTK